MEKNATERSCYFCGSKELYFGGAFTLEEQPIYYWMCEDCLNDFLNQAVINYMLHEREGKTLH